MEPLTIRYAIQGDGDAVLWEMIEATLPRRAIIALLQECPDVLDIEVRDGDDDLILHASVREADGQWYDLTTEAQEAQCLPPSHMATEDEAQELLNSLIRLANADI